MKSYLNLILLLMAAATLVRGETTAAKPKTMAATTERRDKRQLTNSMGTGSLYPIFFDNSNVSPPLQPPLQPITVVTPVTSNAQLIQQPPGFLPNLPIIGTLVGNLPGLPANLISGLGLGNLGGGFGGLGGLNLANLGLGLGNLGGGLNPAPTAQCPLTQKLSCRCEPLISLPPGVKPPGASQLREPQTQMVQIMKQHSRRNEDGSQELRVILSSGLVIYQKTTKQQGQMGYYALRIQEGRYFTIYYSINETDYTVRADVNGEPPKTEFDKEINGQL